MQQTLAILTFETHGQGFVEITDDVNDWIDASGIRMGDPLLLSLSDSPNGPVRATRLGPDIIAGDRPQVVVGAHEWQSAVPLPGTEGYTLVSCIVTPGFRFSGFTLAPPEWRPGT